MLPVVELKNGVEKKADKKMFPGYVLINMVMNDDTWYVVRNTRGVTGFVGRLSRLYIGRYGNSYLRCMERYSWCY